MKLLLVLLLLILPMTAAAQINPCTTSVTQTVLNPAKTFATLPQHLEKELDGTDRVTDYQVIYYVTGALPTTTIPVAGPVTVPKASWTLVPGTTDCYQASLLAPVPTSNLALQAAIKARRVATATMPAAESTWSASSNPFGLAPSALAAPGPPSMVR